MDDVIRCMPFFLSALAVPFIAKLLDSVPQEVKSISSLSAPISEATCSLAAARPFLGSSPKACMLAGLPKCWLRYGSITGSTSGCSGVVLPLSMYTFLIYRLLKYKLHAAQAALYLIQHPRLV